MRKHVSFIFGLLIIVCIAACGSDETSTTVATPIYDTPVSLAAYKTHMGGAVQGTPLTLKDGNVNIVSTFAGSAATTGAIGSAGNLDGSGSNARFNHPTDITTDGTNFYVADYANNAIRQVAANGDVTTLNCTNDGTIPTGFYRPSGITNDGTNLYIVDSGNNTIRFINITTKIVTTIGSISSNAGSVDSTIPADVRFNRPTGITTDGENLYVADSGNHTIRRIVIATKAVSTLAGAAGVIGSTDGTQGTAHFYLPARITTDGINLYVTDFNNRTIRKIEILTGKVTTIAGTPGSLGTDKGTADGTGEAAHFNQPSGITTDGTNLFVTDQFQNTIRKIVIATGAVTTISGISGTDGFGGSVDSTVGNPSFYTPVGITTDGNSLFLADSQNNTIRKIQ